MSRLHRFTFLFQVLLLTSRFFCHTSHSHGNYHNQPLFNQYRGGYQNQNQGNEYYDILGIKRTATEKEIKRAYRDKAMKIHPDRGGNTEEFKKLAEAYEILSNAEKKNAYDKFGKARLNGQYNDDDDSNNPFGADLNSFFRGFGSNFGQSFGSNFGSGRGFPGFSMPVIYRLDLSLEDLYKGKKLKIPIQVAASQNPQQQSPPQEHIDISIEPGMASGFELIVRGVGSNSYGGGGQDIIFRIHEKDHPVFTRQHADLLMELKITLQEALFGFQRNITHLDSRVIYFQSPVVEAGSSSSSSSVIQPDDVFALENEGMPVYGEYKKKGKLYIKIKLQMPKQFGSIPISSTSSSASRSSKTASGKNKRDRFSTSTTVNADHHLRTGIDSEQSVAVEKKKRKKMLSQFRKLYCTLSGESPLTSDTEEEDDEEEVTVSVTKFYDATNNSTATTDTTANTGTDMNDTTSAPSSSSNSINGTKTKSWNTKFKHHFLSQKQNQQQRTASQPLSSSTSSPLLSAAKVAETLEEKESTTAQTTAEEASHPNYSTSTSQKKPKRSSSPSTTAGAEQPHSHSSQHQTQPPKQQPQPTQQQYKRVKRGDLKSFGSIGRREAEQEDDYESTFQRFFFR